MKFFKIVAIVCGLYIFFDWFRIKWNYREMIVEPMGTLEMDISEGQITRCVMKCSREQIEDGDLIPMQVKFVNNLAKKSDTKTDSRGSE